ncbi:ferric-rhodotorulic acid/ferric-coprogen receptor FhuE [Pectobacterium wasabiae]|uniref:Ferric-rhodotorulic acid transporter n=1 Tax=Pectobacterium wasabiae TaxID=55208 RepID=A0AAW3EJV6_9GAMM|nr:ferric-rhodotorulic acid/ferric-coprogen receptor FhuE [Pectobacterium wasabiae]AOR63917.1 ferric-rhodotorulic acid/ferric-coprogen receptor FhuE [Pectobacterium wasabiae CFBP 3304]EJS94311.1 Ferric-rhodotorulic acid outer membrane transporter [Pectobacterium wasabiae CFBP 3304]KFX08536.1 ferric-rhodotorulic acid transporter [Pectobacterium wasabiae]KGA28563.1 ferric-rhodotorulic acid transporter [Pectobacterium wasabiae]
MSLQDGKNSADAFTTSGTKITFSISLLALAITVTFHPTSLYAAQAAVSDASSAQDTSQEMVVVAREADVSVGKYDYSAKTTRAGTKMLMTQRDIPQSVSIMTEQRIQDQNLQSVGEVLRNTTGVSASLFDERSSFYSRGFAINNYLFDDIPTSVSEAWNFGDADDDTAIFDRIEVVRGATGLMTGAGNPSASVNMVRKHADSREFSGNVSASYGSWDKQRYVADLSAPLNESGSVRGRVVAGYQDQNSWLDRYQRDKKFLYGVVDADITDNTTLSLGYSYQTIHTDGATWGGVTPWFSNGARTHFNRSMNPAAEWTYFETESKKVFANLRQDFDNGWTFRVNGTHAESNMNGKLLYVTGFPDQTTGIGTIGYGTNYTGERKQLSVDSYANGPFELLGRQHELVTGVSYSRQHNSYYGSPLAFPNIGSLYHWNGSVQEPTWGEKSLTSDDTVRQKAAYSVARFSLADPLHLILGARYTQWQTNGSSADMKKSNITPYGGLIYDINDTVSAYTSYTSIFQPQSRRDSSGSYLAPITGKNYETGLKADWFNGRLTSTLAVFRIEQDNVGQVDGNKSVNGTAERAYYATQGAVSKGVEFELNGAVTDNLQLTFGASRYVARDTKGRFNSNMPQTQVKLFTRYQLPALPELTVGGGVNWQNRTFQEGAGPLGTTRIYQSSYPLVDLFARYQVTKQLAVQANVKNLFDRSYYTWLSNDSGTYGEPLNYSLNMSYAF